MVSVLLIVVSLVVLLTVVLTKKGEVPSIFGYSLFRVMTGSMEPAIPTDSLILVRRTAPEELRVGDVISFFSRDPALLGEVNTHRITALEEEGGRLLIHTRGDANNVEDRYPTYEEDLVGRVVFSSVFLGKAVRLISNPLIFFPLVILPLLVLVGRSLYDSVKIAKELARQEEEEAVREAIEALRQKKEREKNKSEKIEK